MSDFKTNVMRMLDKAKINYKHYTYANTDAISGIEVATVLEQNPAQVFKTLVTVAKKDDRSLIVVTLGHDNKFKQYNDTKILLDYGFGSFYRFVISKDDLKGMVKLKKSQYADIQNDFVIILPTDVKRENLTQSVDVINNEIFITLKGGENDVTQKIGVVAENNGGFGAAVLNVIKLIFTVLLYLILIFVVLFIILLIYINKRNKKRIAEKKKKERINSNYKYYNM